VFSKRVKLLLVCEDIRGEYFVIDQLNLITFAMLTLSFLAMIGLF